MTEENPQSKQVRCSLYPSDVQSCLCLQDAQLQAHVIHACRDRGVWLAWLNVRMPEGQFGTHQASQRSRDSMKELLYMFDLIMPEADTVSPAASAACRFGVFALWVIAALRGGVIDMFGPGHSL